MLPRTFASMAVLVGVVFVAAAYVPDLGRGFVKDDAAWVVTGAAALERPSSAFSVDSSGYFFRPLVTASFAADYALHRTDSRWYGVTNLMLFIGCVVALAALFKRLGIGTVATGAGLLAWSLNPHGISMALLWISGRTSLLMALCSTLSVLAFVQRQRAIGALLLVAALFAKEDAVAVPLITCACMYAARGVTRREMVSAIAWMAAALAAYAALRLRTNAMTPATAPWYYRLLTNPAAIALNGVSYVDRAGTSSIVVAAAAALLYRTAPGLGRARRLAIAGTIWFVAGLAITVRIPVRSDLYAVFPSAGAAMLCAAWIDACRSRLTPGALAARDRLFAIALAALLLLVPVYRARNARFVEPARLSALVQQRLAADADALPREGTIVFEDAPARFSTFADAFDGMASTATGLFTGRALAADIAMPPDAATRPGEIARYALRDGQVVRVR